MKRRARTYTAPPSREVRDEGFRRAARLAEGLYPHQVDGVGFLLARRRAILADDMGLGKTRQAVVAVGEVAPEGPYLIVCPAAVKRHWAQEITRLTPEAPVVVVGERESGGGGRAGASDEIVVVAGSWVIVSYDSLGRCASRLVKIRFAAIVVDEAHYLKHQARQRNALARRIVEASPDAIVYALTGTSLLHRPRDLFPLLQLCGHPLGRSFKTFSKQYCTPRDDARNGDAVSQIEDLAQHLRGIMLRRSHEEVRSLPAKSRTWLTVDVPTGLGLREVRAVIGGLIDGRLAATRARGATPNPEPTRSERLSLMAQLNTARRKLAVAKVPFTTDLVDGAVEQGEKVIVFSCFNEPLRKIRAHFGNAALLLTGATPPNRRQKLVARFQSDPAVRVLACNILASGRGASLTAARQVVFNDLDWVSANHFTAEDRVGRVGRTGTVNVSYLVGAGTIDEFVQRVLESKAAMVSTVVEGDAMAPEIGADVLSDLERALCALESSLEGEAEMGDGRESQVLRRIAALLDGSDDDPTVAQAAASGLSRDALLHLADVLSGTPVRRYRMASTCAPDTFHSVDVTGSGDVVCSCTGFESRGVCDHARRLTEWLAAGGPMPDGYTPEPE